MTSQPRSPDCWKSCVPGGM
ncbi:rCG62576 [Rattus norvegicus]|uniref:RCG62576 n=1 Tax=Rattus norvegicus TaxID=10116 RepID=A6J5W5_RAT|nr:rCG62576 [Rattus norvegicus]